MQETVDTCLKLLNTRSRGGVLEHDNVGSKRLDVGGFLHMVLGMFRYLTANVKGEVW